MSYGNWYKGFGLSISATLIFSAFLAWRLGSMAKKGSKEVKMLGWSVVVWQIPGVVLSFLYFGVPPMILGTPVTVLVGVAAADVHVKRATPA
jgi:dolichyl-phosphate-mannose--protein O-mannosyl transferase